MALGSAAVALIAESDAALFSAVAGLSKLAVSAVEDWALFLWAAAEVRCSPS